MYFKRVNVLFINNNEVVGTRHFKLRSENESDLKNDNLKQPLSAFLAERYAAYTFDRVVVNYLLSGTGFMLRPHAARMALFHTEKFDDGTGLMFPKFPFVAEELPTFPTSDFSH